MNRGEYIYDWLHGLLNCDLPIVESIDNNDSHIYISLLEDDYEASQSEGRKIVLYENELNFEIYIYLNLETDTKTGNARKQINLAIEEVESKLRNPAYPDKLTDDTYGLTMKVIQLRLTGSSRGVDVKNRQAAGMVKGIIKYFIKGD